MANEWLDVKKYLSDMVTAPFSTYERFEALENLESRAFERQQSAPMHSFSDEVHTSV